jgi:hypothetical protein
LLRVTVLMQPSPSYLCVMTSPAGSRLLAGSPRVAADVDSLLRQPDGGADQDGAVRAADADVGQAAAVPAAVTQGLSSETIPTRVTAVPSTVDKPPPASATGGAFAVSLWVIHAEPITPARPGVHRQR